MLNNFLWKNMDSSDSTIDRLGYLIFYTEK